MFIIGELWGMRPAHYIACILFIGFLSFGVSVYASDIPTVEYCALVTNPALYDGKEIRLHGIYSVAGKTDLFFCSSCDAEKLLANLSEFNLQSDTCPRDKRTGHCAMFLDRGELETIFLKDISELGNVISGNNALLDWALKVLRTMDTPRLLVEFNPAYESCSNREAVKALAEMREKLGIRPLRPHVTALIVDSQSAVVKFVGKFTASNPYKQTNPHIGLSGPTRESRELYDFIFNVSCIESIRPLPNAKP